MEKPRAGLMEAGVVTVGLALALVVTWIVLGTDSDISGSRLTGLFVVSAVIVPLTSLLIGYKLARIVRAPGSAWLWAAVCLIFPFVGVVLTFVMGIAFGSPYSRRRGAG